MEHRSHQTSDNVHGVGHPTISKGARTSISEGGNANCEDMVNEKAKHHRRRRATVKMMADTYAPAQNTQAQ